MNSTIILFWLTHFILFGRVCQIFANCHGLATLIFSLIVLLVFFYWLNDRQSFKNSLIFFLNLKLASMIFGYFFSFLCFNKRLTNIKNKWKPVQFIRAKKNKTIFFNFTVHRRMHRIFNFKQFFNTTENHSLVGHLLTQPMNNLFVWISICLYITAKQTMSSFQNDIIVVLPPNKPTSQPASQLPFLFHR